MKLYLVSFLTSCFLVSDNFYIVSPRMHHVFTECLRLNYLYFASLVWHICFYIYERTLHFSDLFFFDD